MDFTAEINFGDVLDFLPLVPSSGMDPGIRCHGMKANTTEYLWSKFGCFLKSGRTRQNMDF